MGGSMGLFLEPARAKQEENSQIALPSGLFLWLLFLEMFVDRASKLFFNLNCYVWVLPFLSVPSLDLKHLLMNGHLQGQNLARMSRAGAHATPRKKMLVSMSRVKEQVMVGAHPVRVLPICHYLNQKQPLMRKNHLQGPTIKGAPWAKAHPDPKINDMLIPNHQWLFGTFFLLGMELLWAKAHPHPKTNDMFLQKSVCLCPDQSQWLFGIFPSGCPHSTTWPIMTCTWWGRATYYSKTWK